MFSWLFPPAKPVIRTARGPDAPALARIHAEGFERAWGVHDFEAMLAESNIIGHIVAKSGWPAGFVLSRKAADEAEILSICVARKQRGQGFAGALLAHHVSTLARERVRRLFLEVEAGNEPALKLYRGYGFAEIGRRKSYYRKPDGTSADALMMARDL